MGQAIHDSGRYRKPDTRENEAVSERLDQVLDVLDVGLQGSSESGYGTDHSPGRCARCRSVDVTEGDLCAGCRSFLLGDTDDDPRCVRLLHAGVYTVSVAFDPQPFIEAVTRFGADALTAFDRMSEALAASGTSIEELQRQAAAIDTEPDMHRIRHGSAAYCPRHGATKGGTCLKCARGTGSTQR